MLLPDVNVLVYAHRRDSIRNHAEYADWIYGLATAQSPSHSLSWCCRVSSG